MKFSKLGLFSLLFLMPPLLSYSQQNFCHNALNRFIEENAARLPFTRYSGTEIPFSLEFLKNGYLIEKDGSPKIFLALGVTADGKMQGYAKYYLTPSIYWIGRLTPAHLKNNSITFKGDGTVFGNMGGKLEVVPIFTLSFANQSAAFPSDGVLRLWKIQIHKLKYILDGVRSERSDSWGVFKNQSIFLPVSGHLKKADSAFFKDLYQNLRP